MSLLERIPELICPQCHGQFIENGESSLECVLCHKEYPIISGIPHLLDDDATELSGEILVQDRVAVEYEKLRYHDQFSSRYHRWWTSEMLKNLDLTGRILDNGCGIGLLDSFVENDRLVGFDISSVMLSYASAHVSNLVLGNCQALPFADSSFDLVICRSLLHHLQEPQKAVSEISRILVPRGKITLADTNTSMLSYLPRVIAKRGEHFSEDHKNMSLSYLKEIIEPCFKIIDFKYFGYVAYPIIGFPDLVKVFQYLPFKKTFYHLLMAIDRLLSHTPILSKQSWGIIIKAEKR